MLHAESSLPRLKSNYTQGNAACKSTAKAGGAQVSAETELNWNTVKVVQPRRPRKSQQTEESIRKVLQHCFMINGALLAGLL